MLKFPSTIRRSVVKGLAYILMTTPLVFNCAKAEFKDLEEEESKTILYENVEVLKEDDLARIEKIDSLGNISFSEAQKYSKGDILVAGISEKTPKGLLKKIERVSSNDKSFETTNAPLDELIAEGEISFSEKIELEKFEGLKGITYDRSTFTYEFNEVLVDLDGDNSTIDDQIKITGGISFDITTNVDAKFNWGNIEFLFETEINEKSTLEAIANVNLFDFNKEVKVFSASGPTFPVLGVLLWATPEFELYVGTNGKLDANAKTKLENDFYFFGGIYYDNGWSSKADISNDFTFYEPEISIKGNIEAYCKPKLNLIINEALGPSAGVKGYLDLEIDNQENPWWELYGGIDVFLGISPGWLTNKFGDYEKTILEFRDTIANSGILNELEAKLAASPSEGFPPLGVLFDGSSSTGDIVQYFFEFGDGQESEGENGKVNYVYGSFGTYYSKLTVKDISGKTSSGSLEILVKEPLVPTAQFDISPESGDEETVFNFDASSSYDDEDNFENLFFRWDFEGDGAWETEFGKEYIKNYQYDSAGNYNPVLEVKDSRGLVGRLSQGLIVEASNETIELLSDDGSSEFFEWFSGNCSSSWWGEGHLFKKYFNCEEYNLKLTKVKFMIDSKSSNNSDLYVSFWDEEGNDLIPDIYISKVAINQSELEPGVWIEKDISSYDIEINGGRLEINISENLPENCSENLNIYGTKISVDNSSKGNSIMYSIRTAYNFYTYVEEREVDGEFLIRLDGKIQEK